MFYHLLVVIIWGVGVGETDLHPKAQSKERMPIAK